MKPLYIFRDEQRLGPFDPTDVQRLLNTGQLSRDDPAWTEGLDRWEPLQVVLPKALAGEGDFQLGDPSRETTRTIVEPKARPFLLDVPLALVCPLRGAGPFLLVAATVALVAAGLLPYANWPHRPVRGTGYGGALCVFVILTVIFYYAAAVTQVIRSTASGDDELADVLDLASIQDEMSQPLLQILGTVAGCLAPAGIAWYWSYRGILAIEWLPPALLAAGLFYLPMGLLATTILGGVWCGLSPRVVLPAIVRSLPRYLVILLFLAGTFFGAWWAIGWLNQRLIPIAAGSVIIFLVLYLGVVQARLLGLLFKNCKNRLGWFG